MLYTAVCFLDWPISLFKFLLLPKVLTIMFFSFLCLRRVQGDLAYYLTHKEQYVAILFS